MANCFRCGAENAKYTTPKTGRPVCPRCHGELFVETPSGFILRKRAVEIVLPDGMSYFIHRDKMENNHREAKCIISGATIHYDAMRAPVIIVKQNDQLIAGPFDCRNIRAASKLPKRYAVGVVIPAGIVPHGGYVYFHDSAMCEDEVNSGSIPCTLVAKCRCCSKIMHTTTGNPLCKECANKMKSTAFICNNCGDYRVANQLAPIMLHGHAWCTKCLPNSAFRNMFEYEGAAFGDGWGRSIGYELEMNLTEASNRRLMLCGPKTDVKSEDGTKHLGQSSTPIVNIHEDGSLRGKDDTFPLEVVSPILYESNYREWLNTVFAAIDDGVMLYPRTSMHIHIGGTGIDTAKELELLRWLIRYENFFFSIVAKSRRNNEFCTRLAVPGDGVTAKNYMSWFYGGRGPNSGRRPQAGPMSRYAWANLHSLRHHGTVEIRLHHGVDRATPAKMWGGMWLSIINNLVGGGLEDAKPRDVIPEHIMEYYRKRRSQLEAIPYTASNGYCSSRYDANKPADGGRIVTEELD